MDATRDVTLGSTTYQVTRIGARDGSWLVAQFLRRGLLTQIEDPTRTMDDRDLGLAFAASFANFPEAIFDSIQSKCLGACRKYDIVGDVTVPRPLLMADGRWAVEEPDLVTVTALMVASLVFSLSPFFAPGALQTLLQVFPDLSKIPDGSPETAK